MPESDTSVKEKPAAKKATVKKPAVKKAPAKKATGAAVAVKTEGLTVNRETLFQEGFLDLKSVQVDPKTPLSMDQLNAIAVPVSASERNARWWHGDLLVYAEDHYNELAYQLADARGQDPKYISQFRWVARVFPPNERMIPNEKKLGLTWTHHRTLATLWEKDKALGKKVAKDAIAKGMSVEDLKKAIKEATAIEVTGEKVESEAPAANTSTIMMSVSVPKEHAAGAKKIIDEIQKSTLVRLKSDGITATAANVSVKGAVDQEG